MEQLNKKIYSGTFLIFFSFILAIMFNFFSCIPVMADNGLGNVSLERFTSPKYDEKTNKLQYIVTGKNAQTVGPFIKITDVKVELISSDGKSIKAVISTPEAFYNQALQTMKGDKPLHYRSKAADADGIGFHASMKTQVFHIKKGVKLLIKSAEALQDENNSSSPPPSTNETKANKTAKNTKSNAINNTK